MNGPILALAAVSKVFFVEHQEIRAVDAVSLEIAEGECLAIVGESGSGKSTLANMVLGIYPPTSGEIRFRGELLPARRKRHHRSAIQLVQQNPLSSLNPKRSIGTSLRLALDVHGIGQRSGRRTRVGELLEEVGLPADTAHRMPAALSGGQRQRVAIARALACQSHLVVLDEPTSALDVLVQARVLKLLNELRLSRGLSYMFITHDLSVVRNIADRVAVFQNGRMMELGATERIFAEPEHPYTRQLISAVPVIDEAELALRERLAGEQGEHADA